MARNGNLIGPASSTDNAIARFDSTTGTVLQNSAVTIDDSGVVAGVTSLAITGSDTITSTYRLKSGIYSPTVGDEANIASHGTAYASWILIGTQCFVTGIIDITATGAGEVDFSLTLPLSTTLAGNDLYGHATGVRTAAAANVCGGPCYRSGNKAFFVTYFPATTLQTVGFNFAFQIK
jgi:hypothetical protein